MSQRVRSKRSFVGSLAGIPICAAAIFFGVAFTGGGHGSSSVFVAALALCVADGLMLAYSVWTGIQAERAAPGTVPWLRVSIPLLILAIVLALWGLQG